MRLRGSDPVSSGDGARIRPSELRIRPTAPTTDAVAAAQARDGRLDWASSAFLYIFFENQIMEAGILR
jgi:hypothetical protein